jgi:hypothetical protein
LGITRPQAPTPTCRIHLLWRQSARGSQAGRGVAIIVEARALMHVTDDLLRLSTATVPLVASAVTGMFLFVNRSGRRIERLRTLVEIHASLPGHLNPNNAVQRAILWQLAEVQLWATPWFRLVRLYLCVMGGLFLLLFVAGTFPMTLGIPHDFAAAIRWMCIGLTVIVPIPPYVAYRRHRSQTSVPYRLAFKILDSMNEWERAHEVIGGANSSELERSVIAETIEAFDATRNGGVTARRAESSAKQATNHDRITDYSTERD